MSAIVTPTAKTSSKPYYLVAAVLVAALVVVAALAIGAWAANDRGGSTAPTRAAVAGNVESPNAASPQLQSVNVSPNPSVQSVNAASPELHRETSPRPPARVTAAECRLTGPC